AAGRGPAVLSGSGRPPVSSAGRPDGPGRAAQEDPVDVPEGLRAALEYGLADAVRARRSRRFGLGMTMPEGPLAHTSAHAPVPLSELEQAFLVWAGTGATGLALGDLPRDGLSWMHGWDGRSWPCSLNSHSTHLFLSDDDG